MAAATQKNKSTPANKDGTKVAKKAASAQRSQKPEAAKPPAYLQAKMAISHPQDGAEKEADKVAQQVARAPKATPAAPAIQKQDNAKKAQRASLEPEINAEKGDTLALKPVPAAETIQRRPVPENSAEQQLDKKTAAPGKDDTTQVQREAADPMAGQTTSADTEARIEARRGGGATLPDAAKRDMEGQFGQDFSQVRIHTDSEAADLCAETNARAFTVGSDIFFAPGEFSPESDSGRELLAHELTHVVQQGGTASTIQRRIESNPEVSPAPPTPPAPTPISQQKLTAISTLPLPQNKRRHLALYQSWQQAGRLKRLAGYDREEPDQSSLWNQNSIFTPEAFNEKLQARGIPIATASSDIVRIRIGNRDHSHTRNEWLYDYLRRPTWNRTGSNETFQVDHIVELQVSGEHGEGVGNSMENMELFDADSNTSSGRTLKNSMRARVREYQESLTPAQRHRSVSAWLRDYSIVFENVTVDSGGTPESQSSWWTHSEITNFDPINQAVAPTPVNIEGSAREFVLASGAGGVVMGRYPRTPEGNRSITLNPDTPAAKSLSGFIINRFELAANIGAANTPGQSAGTVECLWNLPEQFHATNANITLPLQTVGVPHAAAVGPIPRLDGDFSPLSPFSFEEISIRDGALYAEGTILPSLPLLANSRLAMLLRGDDIVLAAIIPLNTLQLQLPAVSLNGGTLMLFYSKNNGFGIEGGFDFNINQLGGGDVEARYTQAHGFELLGTFSFDSALFDQNSISMWYRDEQFGMSGNIGITSADKVRGIRSANLQMRYEAGHFNATGTVEPNIPGVQQAGLQVDYAEETGLTIGGNLQLAPNPAIRSGSVDVTVRKVDDQWKVAATGTAQPAIPGIDSQLTVGYDDGAFTAEFSGSYARGMMSGSATVGVTNRTVGEDGRPSGTPAPDAPLVVYGNGSATLQIAPWLQGTAGIRFAPNGEVTLSGEIGLPSSLEIFSIREVNRSLFGMSTQIPIFPGIVAEVGGNLSAHASIGPGALDQMRIGIEYNPSHEENTRITGDAHLNIPAEAGLRLAARAGIGLGITGASATGGLELGGTLGISGAAEASVHIEWTPGSGLQIDAEGYLHAEPKFKFDVSGYVAVTALGFSVYDNTWRLAEYELGSNLRLGVRFPIHYQEGRPFNVSLDDVQFEVPDVDPAAMVRDLGNRIF